ncbi:MAG: hypothetical protein OWQ50_08700, partial [Acidianus infernus]|nr:hypothetical protein [Acidianus infernus]
LYEAIYKPRKGGVVISRVPVEDGVKKEIINNNVFLIDDVGFDRKRLEILVERMTKGIKASYDVRELAYKFAMSRKEEFIEWMKSQGLYWETSS